MGIKQQLNWTESCLAEMAMANERHIGVADEQTYFRAQLPEGMTVAEALEDYVAGYDSGDYHGELVFDWELYEGGEEVDRGMHTIER